MDEIKGLTNEEIQYRIENNMVNYDTSIPTKSIKQILCENFITLFNILNLLLAIAVFCVGSYKNCLFLLIVIINTAISTIQEIHSKHAIDKLSILSASKAKVLRNNKWQEINIYDIVIDEIISFSLGDQVTADSIVQNGEVLVDESFITGEPNSISKKSGDTILSGSFIISGKCIAKVIHVGKENYTAKISNDAKHLKKTYSEIMKSLNKIIKFLTYAIIPIGSALFYSQFYIQDSGLQESIVQTVAAIIGMIPEGLVLLTSTVLAISVTRLSKSKVLVQDLYCIETLARVDTLCIDKTGTLTEGTMELKDFIPYDLNKKDIMSNILYNFSKFSEDENATMLSIKNYFDNIQYSNDLFSPIRKIPFSSDKKWSGIEFRNVGTYILGAPEFVLKENFENFKFLINKYSKDYRVLVLTHSPNFKGNNLPNCQEVIGFVLLSDIIKSNASSTLNFFKTQGVDIKMISGDNPITVSQIAKRVGLNNYENYIDMSKISDEINLKDIVNKYSIFGRVSPFQKKELIKALQNNGKTVAMTGDGVNDVLALKEADCSLAMANGSDAARNVSKLVLLNSDFDSMPKIVSEGRRTINNIQRSASLFLVKTIYSSILALLFIFMSEQYPFIPIQLSLISFVTIGIPSLLLALEPNKEKITGNFLRNVIANSLPTALTVVFSILLLTLLKKYNILLEESFSSLCVISTGITGILLLFTLSKSRKSEDNSLPFSIYRLALALSMVILFIVGLTAFGWFFNIVKLSILLKEFIYILIFNLITFTILNLLFKKLK